MSWDPAKIGGSFIDNVQGGVLFGSEITKVRKNAATATPTERAAYLAALRKIAVDPAFNFPGVVSYWRTQQQVHRFGPTNRHGQIIPGGGFIPSVAFLPWHREYINRYEGLLQEADPTVKLLYWQWTENPVTGPFDYSAMMGNFGLGQPAGVQIGGPVSPDTDGAYVNFCTGLTQVTRRLQPASGIESDATVVARNPYDAATNGYSNELERISHNNAHVYIAGRWGPDLSNGCPQAGDQLLQPYAARDPFFFLLHAKVDELWARWQRRSLNNLDPATTFGTAAGGTNLTTTMGPWNGTAMPDTLPNNLTAPEIEPWTMAGGQSYAKRADDRSVTSPPFYDTARLTIPVLQPGEEVILEIPWYPPNPLGFGAVADPEHVCLIARIETSETTPFGMTVAETTNIDANTRQNNNIAWKNVSVVDTFPGAFRSIRFMLTNGFKEPIKAGLRFGAELNQPGGDFFRLGRVRIDLGRELFERWKAGGGNAQGVEVVAENELRVGRPEAVLEGIELKPGEMFPVRMFFELNRDYQPTKRGEDIVYDVVQIGSPQDTKAVVGGQRYHVSVDKLTPVERGRVWRWLPGERETPENWTSVDFDDSKWFERKLALGWVEPPIDGTHGVKTSTTYFFRYTFDVEDPEFFRNLAMKIKRSDGAIVYLNEKEVYRSNLPDGAPSAQTVALSPVAGLERDVYFPVKLDPTLLRNGRNILAVEIHRAEANRGDLTFDAEVNANIESTQQPAAVQFGNVADGTLLTAGRPATIGIDALKLEGSVRSVTLMVNDNLVGTLEKPPYSFAWDVQAGPNRMRVTVTDSDGLQSEAYATVVGVENVPPVVALTQPTQHLEITAGDVLVAAARAEDRDGKIVRVDFFVHDSYVIGSEARLAGSVETAPYVVTLTDLKPGHAMITAVAYDDGGARTASIPIMVVVH